MFFFPNAGNFDTFIIIDIYDYYKVLQIVKKKKKNHRNKEKDKHVWQVRLVSDSSVT